MHSHINSTTANQSTPAECKDQSKHKGILVGKKLKDCIRIWKEKNLKIPSTRIRQLTPINATYAHPFPCPSLPKPIRPPQISPLSIKSKH